MKTSATVLTSRENDVSWLIASGCSQKEIADILHISEGTVRVHTRNSYRKSGIHKESEFALWYLFHELVLKPSPLGMLIKMLKN